VINAAAASRNRPSPHAGSRTRTRWPGRTWPTAFDATCSTSSGGVYQAPVRLRSLTDRLAS